MRVILGLILHSARHRRWVSGLGLRCCNLYRADGYNYYNRCNFYSDTGPRSHARRKPSMILKGPALVWVFGFRTVGVRSHETTQDRAQSVREPQ